MKMPKWMRRRPPAAPKDDYDACQGADGMEAAFNWMRYVLDRDFKNLPIGRCVIVAEVGEGHHARVVYTTHDVRSTPVEIRGLLEEGLRGLDEIRIRAFREYDIEQFVNAAVPQIVARLRESDTPPTPEEMARVVSGLVRKQQHPEGGMEVEDES